MEQWNNPSSRLSLSARTASVINYIFSIKDITQLVCAVKTLDFSTRLSLDCSMKMMEGHGGSAGVSHDLLEQISSSHGGELGDSGLSRYL